MSEISQVEEKTGINPEDPRAFVMLVVI